MTVDLTIHQLSQAISLHEEKLAAYFQPIIALDTRRISGYEVLGRAVGSGGARSLGSFFGDYSVPMDVQRDVDRYVRELAIARLGQEQEPQKLFLNLKPGWIYRYGEAEESYTLTLLKKYKVDPGNVVIEITEDTFQGSMEVLLAAVDRYRSHGCLIAIDDVGRGYSGMDRIAQIQPHLLKIDMNMVKRSATHRGYYSVLRSFSGLAEQIGASLIFEGVETREDLARAIQSGAQYVQGFLFAQAAPDFIAEDRFSSVIDMELKDHLRRYASSEREWHRHAEHIGRGLYDAVLLSDTAANPDDWLKQLLPRLEPRCLRVYLCDETGIQLSANYMRDEDGSWTGDARHCGANWSWRPYFVPNLVQLGDTRRAIVSRAYTDLETKEWIRTISVRVDPAYILFADIRDAENGMEQS